MKITLLGTGTSQGVPVIACSCDVCLSDNQKDKRLRSSVMIEVDGQTIVVDTGPDFRQQMLRENVQKVDAILFTHEHKDHIAGMDDVRAFNHKWKKNMEIFATKRVGDALKREFHYVFSGDDYPGIPRVNINTISNTPFKINETEIIPIEVMHYKMPVFGFRIQNFVYITDVSYISDKEKEKIKDADLLIIDSLRKTKHISHFALDESLKLIEEVNPKKALFTHISHFMGKHDNLIKELPENVSPAFDGETILLNKRK
jgi:phosphoribosyl 1,2-cyclic phosphate phosphodiesterase